MTVNDYRALHEKSPDEAYNALFESFCDYVYAIVFNKLRSVASREDIEECMSDVFAGIFFRFDADNAFDGDMKGYVGTVAKRKAINAFHRLTASSVHFSEETEEYLSGMISDTNIEADHDKGETRTVLIKRISELGEPDSTIILQKYYYDRSSKEIAKLLSMKASAVRMRAARALDKLKKTLEADGITF